MKRIIPLLILAAAGGCANVNTVALKVTEPHKPIPPQDVRLALEAPANAVYVADIYSDSCDSERGSDAAQADMKRKAASLGANVIVIENVNEYLDSAVIDHHFRVEGRAYFSE